MTAFEIFAAPGEKSVAELFSRLFADASLGWIVPVYRAGHEGGSAAVPARIDGERFDAETGYTEWEGPTRTAATATEVATELARATQPAATRPIWCALSVRVPKGRGLARRTVFRKNGAPLAVIEVLADRLRLSFPSGEPIVARVVPNSALESDRWALAAKIARAELEQIFERLRAGGSRVVALQEKS